MSGSSFRASWYLRDRLILLAGPHQFLRLGVGLCRLEAGGRERLAGRRATRGHGGVAERRAHLAGERADGLEQRRLAVGGGLERVQRGAVVGGAQRTRRDEIAAAAGLDVADQDQADAFAPGHEARGRLVEPRARA